MPLPSSNDVVSWETHRSRQYEIAKTEAGTAKITLRDTTGKYDPTNPNGAYYGYTQPLKQSKINVLDPANGNYHDIFTGYIEDWDFGITPGEEMQTITLSLTDGLEPLSRAELTPDSTGRARYASQHVDDHIRALLADAGWPSAMTNIFTGNVNVLATAYDPGTKYIEALDDACDAEFPGVANRFIAKNGYFTFHGRFARFNPENFTQYGISIWDVADRSGANTNASWVPIASDDFEWNRGQAFVYNAALAYPVNTPKALMAGQIDSDAVSIANYGYRTISWPNLITGDNNDDGLDRYAETFLYSRYYVENFAYPQNRINQIHFDSATVTESSRNWHSLWRFLVGVEIGDLIRVHTNHPGGGGFRDDNTLGNQFFVEGIHNTVTALKSRYPHWQMTLDLSPRQWSEPGPFPSGPN